MTHVDILVAVRNEEEAIPPFVAEVRALRLPGDTRFRIVFVEDSSTDGTRELLRRFASEDAEITYYMVKNEFGQGPALVFGLARCTADAVIMMDVDGTHPVSAIPELIARFLQGDQIVQCTRRAAPDRSAYRNLGAAAFRTLARWATGMDIDRQDIYYRLMSAAACAELLNRPRYWRFLRFPLPAAGVSFLPVDSQDRRVGHSKYNFMRLARVAVDAVLSLMPVPRLLAADAVLLIGAAVLWRLGLMWVPGLLVVLTMLLTWRYFALDDPTLPGRMQLLEHGGPAVAAPMHREGVPLPGVRETT